MPETLEPAIYQLKVLLLGIIMMRLTDIIEDGGDIEDHYDEFYDLQYWLTAERFNRKVANRRLCDYASGKEVYMWG